MILHSCFCPPLVDLPPHNTFYSELMSQTFQFLPSRGHLLYRKVWKQIWLALKLLRSSQLTWMRAEESSELSKAHSDKQEPNMGEEAHGRVRQQLAQLRDKRKARRK